MAPPAQTTAQPPPPKATEVAALEQPAARVQLVDAVDGYGAPALFAAVFVFILVELVVKPFLRRWAAGRGLDGHARGQLTLSATLLPGLLAACVVDFAPIAAAFGVTLSTWTAIPVGAIAYAGGGVLLHRAIRELRPWQIVRDRLYGRLGASDEHVEAAYVESTTRAHRAVTDADIEAHRRRGEDDG